MKSLFPRSYPARAAAASAALLLSSLSANAVLTVTLTAVPGEPAFSLADGLTALPDGMFYQLGSFASAPTAQALAADPTAAFAQWQEFSDDTPETIFSILPPGGHAAGDIYGDDSFAGAAIYWWVFLTSDGQAPAADFSNVTEHALFTNPAVNWLFPDSSESPSPVISTSDSGLVFLAGELNGTSGNIHLAAVPEPSAFALSLLALMPLLRRRR